MNTWPPHDPLANANGFSDPQFSVDNAQLFAQNNAVNGNIQFHNSQPQQPLVPQQSPTPGIQQRSQTPQQFPYAVSAVIPSKRPREDGVTASPRQPPATISSSRSQTPQQPSAFPNQLQYQHLQPGGSANATPSPTMQNQQFRGQAQAPRMQTVSPNPQFPQPQQPPQPQQQQPISMSPPPDGSGRVTPQTPQFNMMNQLPGAMGQMQGQPAGQMGVPPGMGIPSQMVGQNGVAQAVSQMNPQVAGSFAQGPLPPGFNPNYPLSGLNLPGNQGNFSGTQLGIPQNIGAQPMDARQLQLRQQLAMQRRMQQAGMGNMMPGQASAVGTPPRPPQPNSQTGPAAPSNAMMGFLRNVTQYMQNIGRSFDPKPMIAGRTVVTATSHWPNIAAGLGFPEPNHAQEMKDVFERCLGPYEVAFVQHAQNQQKQHGQPPAAGTHMSPARRITQSPHLGPLSRLTGPDVLQAKPPAAHTANDVPVDQARADLSIPTQLEAMNNGSTLPHNEGAKELVSMQSNNEASTSQQSTPETRKAESGSRSEEANDEEVSVKVSYPDDCFIPSIEFDQKSYGGYYVDLKWIAYGQYIDESKDLSPSPFEMGIIDVRAISLSLQSGIKSEVRYALDVLLKLSWSESFDLDLAVCEDLVDILVDCAEEQLHVLAESAPVILDHIEFPSYEDLLAISVERLRSLSDITPVGTDEHELDGATERLSSVVVILRNLSSSSQQQTRNRRLLAADCVVRFLADVIRLIGTRIMPLRSHVNTLSIMKDVITFLSNVAEFVEIQSKTEAQSLLQFLIAFAPQPNPLSAEELRFPCFQPKRHKYFPLAVDSLAKLLVKDGNREFAQMVFLKSSDPFADAPLTPSFHAVEQPLPVAVHQRFSLFTRTFGLAIAVLPDRSGMHLADEKLMEIREAVIAQGLLAADILVGLLPSSWASAGPPLARAWLGSHDCWVPSLNHFCRSIFNDPQKRSVHDWRNVMNRALGMLRRLATIGLSKKRHPRKTRENAGDPDGADSSDAEFNVEHDEVDDTELDLDQGLIDGMANGTQDWKKLWDGIDANVLPSKIFVMGALNIASMDINVLRNLIALADLDE